MKVSACIITYDHESYIAECIEGALKQQVNFEYEIVIGEDKSTDNTLSICKAYQKKFPNLIRVIERPSNLGMIGNWARSLQECRGEYIALCEGDDYWTDPLKLQKQVNLMDANENLVFCFHASSTINNNGELGIFYKSRHFKDNEVVSKKYFIEKGGGGFATASVLLKRVIIMKIPGYFSNSPVGDFPLALLAISQGDIGYINDGMCTYRIQSTSSWSKQNSDLESLVRHNNSILKVIKEFNEATSNKFDPFLELFWKDHMMQKAIIIRKKSFFKAMGFLINNYNYLKFRRSARLFELFIKGQIYDLLNKDNI